MPISKPEPLRSEDIIGTRGRQMVLVWLALVVAAVNAGCTGAVLDRKQREVLVSLPPGLREAVENEPSDERAEFLSMPAEQREAIVRQWENHHPVMGQFTPAEQMIISGFSRAESDKFFALTRHESQEQFLANTVRRNNAALSSCRGERAGTD